MANPMLRSLGLILVLIPTYWVFAQASAVADDAGAPVFQSGFTSSASGVTPSAVSGERFDQGDPSDQEQYLLELVNRARADPAVEAMRWGIDLNEGLAPGTISEDPKPPLAFHPDLIDAARAHSQWMLETNTFSHTGSGGSSAGDRMTAAGYPFAGNWTWGENISWSGSTGSIDATAATLDLHEGLFLSSGHRENLMNAVFDEVGIGLIVGQFIQSGVWNALMGTQDFAKSDATPGPLLTGVVYRDQNGNAFYDVGEGIEGITVSVTSGSYYAVTSSSGGYALPYTGSGMLQALFSGGVLGSGVSLGFTGGSVNVKLDLDVSDVGDFSLSVSRAGPGSVTSDPAGIDCGSLCTARFSAGSQVTLTATPDAGAAFVGWGGQCSGTNPICSLSMTSARTAVATFEEGTTDPEVNRDTAWRITEIYVATMGYAPDDDGLQYWIGQVETVPVWTPETVAQSFFDQPLVAALYPLSQGYGVFIESLYDNIFGRAVDSEGYQYWLDALNTSSVSRDQMIIALINGGWANTTPEAQLDMQRFGYRIEVALAFADYQAQQGIHYEQLTSAQQVALRAAGREVLAGVTTDSATRDAAIASIPSLLSPFVTVQK